MNPSTPPPTPPLPSHSGLATASMVCGFLVLPTCFSTMLPAIIMGHIAMSNARRDGGNTSRAKLGLIFGYGSLAVIPLIAVLAGLTAPIIIRQRQKADLAQCVSNTRQIGMGLMEYQSDHGSYPPDLKMLETEGITTNIDQLLGLRAAYDGDWLYFPKADTTKPNSPLLVSPPLHQSRVMLQVDGAVRSTGKADLPEPGDDGAPVRIPVPLRIAR